MPYSDRTKTVATGAGNTTILDQSGRLREVLVTTAGTGSGNVEIYDNASAATGTLIGLIPATVDAGTSYTFMMPAAFGITVKNVSNGPVLTISVS